MTISKYDHLIRFDSDDIMYPNLVEKVMIQNTKYDMVRFKMRNYYPKIKRKIVKKAIGQFMIKHWFLIILEVLCLGNVVQMENLKQE